MTKESRDDMIFRWALTDNLEEYLTIGKKLYPKMTREELEATFNKSIAGYQSKDADHMDEIKKSQSTETDMKELAFQLFLDSLPSLDEKEENKSEKESTNKGISQEAINTLLDLSITTEEALDKSAEITIREAEEIAKLNKSEKESRDDMIHRWSMTNDLQEFVRLGKELHPEITEKFWTLVFKDSYKTKEEKAKQQYGRPTLDDFFAATERQEKEAILQQILGESLTPEEIEAFFPKDDD